MYSSFIPSIFTKPFLEIFSAATIILLEGLKLVTFPITQWLSIMLLVLIIFPLLSSPRSFSFITALKLTVISHPETVNGMLSQSMGSCTACEKKCLTELFLESCFFLQVETLWNRGNPQHSWKWRLCTQCLSSFGLGHVQWCLRTSWSHILLSDC